MPDWRRMQDEARQVGQQADLSELKERVSRVESETESDLTQGVVAFGAMVEATFALT